MKNLSAVGYADSRPLVPNDTVENRAKNRRVEIVVLEKKWTPPPADVAGQPIVQAGAASPVDESMRSDRAIPGDIPPALLPPSPVAQ
jgi:chemotaxis protein MotB